MEVNHTQILISDGMVEHATNLSLLQATRMAIEDLLISALGRVKNCGRMHLRAQILLRTKNGCWTSTVLQRTAVVVKLCVIRIDLAFV